MVEGAGPHRIEADGSHEPAFEHAGRGDDVVRGPAVRVVPSARAPAAPEPAPTPPRPAAESAGAGPAVEPPSRRKRGLLRPALFALLPVALLVGGYEYVVGGRFMATDNAYIQARIAGIATDVSGTVVAVEVHNNEAVKAGQVLFRLRPDAFRVALEGAVAQLGTVRNQVLTQQATYKQSLSQIEQAKADLPFYQTTLKRQQDLINSAVASKATFDQAEHDLVATRQKVLVAQAEADAMLAQLGGDPNQPVERNPFYLQAKAAVDNAQRDLDDTVVRAPFDGVVTNVDALPVGTYLKAAQPGFSLVSSTDVWVEAAPKETELTYVRPGQPVTVTVDTYPGVEWRGTVDSINPASGSSFSMLPAQNTTGNWVKVVQRIPMRIRIDMDPNKPPLRVGMSVTAEVDTGHARGLPRFVTDLLDRYDIHHA